VRLLRGLRKGEELMVERSCFKEFSDETRPELLHVGWHIGGCWPSGFCYPNTNPLEFTQTSAASVR